MNNITANHFDYILSELGHDIKSSISVITMSLEMVAASGDVSAKQELYINRAIEHAEFISEIVTSVLELSWLESDVRPVFSPVDVQHLLQDSVQLMEPRAQARGIALKLSATGKLGVIEGEGDRLKRVLLNLIGNAIKYNRPNGTVYITAKSKSGRVLITVRDEGHGIAEEDQKQIFTRFFRADSARKNKIEGTGLGLSIAKEIVERHDGRVWFETRQGEGTTFFVDLPRQQVSSREGQDALQREPSGSQELTADTSDSVETMPGEAPDGVADDFQESEEPEAAEREDSRR